MIILHVETPYASFRKSFARSFAESYSLPPPSTVYGMLLSLVGEHFRRRHEGVRLAFAYKQMPRIATTIRKLSRYKYGIPSKQSTLGNTPDFIETLCNIEFLCWVDSTLEKPDQDGDAKGANLEQRLLTALQNPQDITRRGVVCLGLSDDAVNDVSLCETIEGSWYRLLPDGSVGLPLIDEKSQKPISWHRLFPNDRGSLELPVWADHVTGFNTRFQRYEFEKTATETFHLPDSDEWLWTEIIDPRK